MYLAIVKWLIGSEMIPKNDYCSAKKKVLKY